MTSTSVELRLVTRGEYSCGTALLRSDHAQCVACDWGVIEHSQPRPDRGEVGHLMVTTRSYVDRMLREPGALELVQGGAHLGFHSAVKRDGRTFVSHDYNGQRWTWELFPAHWWDEAPGHRDLLIGKWPD